MHIHLLLLAVLPWVQAVDQHHNNAGETFNYKTHYSQYKNAYDVKGRDSLLKQWPFGPVPACSASVLPEHDNFIAARLAGSWSFHQPLTTFLKESNNSDFRLVNAEDNIELSFTDDASVLDDLTEDKCLFLKQTDRKVFVAGTFGIHSGQHGNHLFPYVLIDHHGISAIVYWPSTGPTAIPMLVQMAPGLKHDNDLLIVGEDSVDKPFGILHRKGVVVPGDSADTEEAEVVEEQTKEETKFDLAAFVKQQGLEIVGGEDAVAAAAAAAASLPKDMAENQQVAAVIEAVEKIEAEEVAEIMVDVMTAAEEIEIAAESKLAVEEIEEAAVADIEAAAVTTAEADIEAAAVMTAVADIEAAAVMTAIADIKAAAVMTAVAEIEAAAEPEPVAAVLKAEPGAVVFKADPEVDPVVKMLVEVQTPEIAEPVAAVMTAVADVEASAEPEPVAAVLKAEPGAGMFYG